MSVMAVGSWTLVLASAFIGTPLALTATPQSPLALQQPAADAVAETTGEPAPLVAGGPTRSLLRGERLRINGQLQDAAWIWSGNGPQPSELWLPLEVLEGQLGVSRRTKPDGSLDLEWYGHGLVVPPSRQRSVDDEVAIDVADLLLANGVRLKTDGDTLDLRLATPRLLRVREGRQPGVRRLVLDLNGPAVVRRQPKGLQLGLSGDPRQLAGLPATGMRSRLDRQGLTLTGLSPAKVFTLGDPARVVIDLPAPAGAKASATPTRPTPIDPRLKALIGPEITWQRQVQQIAGERFLVNAVQVDPRSSSLELRPLSRRGGMQGLSSLVGLAQHHDALVAINGGFFNRVRRLPLGALKDGGRWLSGPILNRGVVAWEPRALPRFGRLRLNEWLTDPSGRRWPLVVVNSGYVQRGLSRYTADWGPAYRALSGAENALLLRDGVVRQRFGQAELNRGVPLRGDDVLLVGRGGVQLPWSTGAQLRISSRPSSALGEASNVLGGGPLLLQGGRRVLNGGAEGFSPSFLRQGAPRTVIGSDGSRLWLITLEGVDHPGPTLTETAHLLSRMGLRDALNLDGGSSTGLVMGGQHTVKGRGVAGSVHNGIGLVPQRRDLRSDARS